MRSRIRLLGGITGLLLCCLSVALWREIRLVLVLMFCYVEVSYPMRLGCAVGSLTLLFLKYFTMIQHNALLVQAVPRAILQAEEVAKRLYALIASSGGTFYLDADLSHILCPRPFYFM